MLQMYAVGENGEVGFLLLGARGGGGAGGCPPLPGMQGRQNDRIRLTSLTPARRDRRYLGLQNENIATASINEQQVFNMKSAE